MSSAQIDAVRGFAHAGGSLVATHKTSLLDEFGNSRGDFGLSHVLNVQYADFASMPVSYLRPVDECQLTMGIDLGVPLMHRDDHLKVSAGKDASTPARLVFAREDVNRVSHNADPPLREDSLYPAIVATARTKGRSVYFPGRPDAIYARFGHPEYKQLLLNAFNWCVGEATMPLRVNAPASVEATLCEQPSKERLIVHLLNYQSDVGRSLRLVSTKFMG